MILIPVRCSKCWVSVEIIPGSVAWHCGQKMVPMMPADSEPSQKEGKDGA